MAKLTTRPDTQTLNATIGTNLQVKLVPKNADGSIFDCTDFDSENTLEIVPTSGPVNGKQMQITMAIVAADATGITVSITEANLDTAFQSSYGVTSVSGYFEASDGTDNILAWVGTLVFQSNPATALGYAL
jgi:hypothetical protein